MGQSHQIREHQAGLTKGNIRYAIIFRSLNRLDVGLGSKAAFPTTWASRPGVPQIAECYIAPDRLVGVHVAARCGHTPAMLLKAYAKRTKKADEGVANVLGTMTTGGL